MLISSAETEEFYADAFEFAHDGFQSISPPHHLIRSDQKQAPSWEPFCWERQMTTQPAIARNNAADIALIVIGPKRLASRFTSADAGKAAKLARSLKMQSVRVTTDRLRDVARRLPAGRLTLKGLKGATQLQPALYKQLLTAAEPTPATPSASGGTDNAKAGAPSDSTAGSPKDHGGLVRGSIVLSTDNPEEGWWPAKIETIDGDNLVLRWVDFELPAFRRRRNQVAAYPTGKPC